MGNSVSAKLCYCLEPWEEGEEPFRDEDGEVGDSSEWLVRSSSLGLPEESLGEEEYCTAFWKRELELPITLELEGHYESSRYALCARLEHDDDTLDLAALVAKEPELHAALEAFCKSANIPCTNPGWRVISFYG